MSELNRPVRVCVSLALGLVALSASPLQALDESGVLVLYNAGSSEGASIADYYADVHPGVRTLGLSGVPTVEQIGYQTYLDVIRPQVLAALDDSVDCIVTTKGMPLRIYNPNPDPSEYRKWSEYSSLESELTRVDAFDTRILMGNQRYDRAAPTGNPEAANPYHFTRVGSVGFDYDVYGMRLAARLDGFDVQDVTGAIDRAQAAFYDRPNYTFVVDDVSTCGPDRMTRLVEEVLDPSGRPYVYEDTAAFLAAEADPVIGYVGWGVNGSAPVDYLTNPDGGFDANLANGAVFHTWESYNAYTFTGDGSNPRGQGLVAQWLARGGTAGLGHVEEPGATPLAVANSDQFIAMLLEGYTLAEAAWNATYQLSFVNTVVGDPLMRFSEAIPGDANGDGKVDLVDFGRLAGHYGQCGCTWEQGDFSGDGNVDLADFGHLANNYDDGKQGGLEGDTTDVPEPASFVLLAVAVTALRRRRGR